VSVAAVIEQFYATQLLGFSLLYSLSRPIYWCIVLFVKNVHAALIEQRINTKVLAKVEKNVTECCKCMGRSQMFMWAKDFKTMKYRASSSRSDPDVGSVT
jgi:hypothetical protein